MKIRKVVMVMLIILVTIKLPEQIMIASSMTTHEMKKLYGISKEVKNYKKELQSNGIYKGERQEHYYIYLAVNRDIV